MNKKQHYVLNEKYRPSSLEGYLCSDYLKQNIEKWIKDQSIPHLGFFGKPGSGKTTLAKILVNNIDCDFLYINAADERSIDIIREKIGGFASSASFKPLKIVILDESTHILLASQIVLLNMIETYSLTTRFILTGNFPERLTDPLRSRLDEYILVPPSKVKVAEHLNDILNKENIQHTSEDIVKIVSKFYPDLRKILNNTQRYIKNNTLVIDSQINISDDFKTKVIQELKSPNKTSLTNIRQIIANSGNNDYDDLFRILYDKVTEYAPNREGEIILIISEMQYQSNFRVDKEINIISCISQILTIIMKKQII